MWSRWSALSRAIAHSRLARVTGGVLVLALCYFAGAEITARIMRDDEGIHFGPTLTPQEITASFDRIERIELPVDRRGADVLVVVFTDYQCVTCKAFHAIYRKVTDGLSAQEASRVRWQVLDFPIDMKCNRAVTVVRHDAACEAAAAARLAAAAGKSDQFTTWLYDKGEALTSDLIWSHAKTLGISKQPGPYAEAQRLVKRDIEIAMAAKVNAAPSIFINGAMLPGPFPTDTMLLLIRHELAKSRRK